ncbi:MAG: monovalent cation/H(+) antiporter subunit G [Bacteroidota bacterium]
MIDLISAIFIFVGSFLILLAAVGLIKMPDIFMRMSATTKAVTLGVGTVLIGTAVFFGDVGIVARAVVIIIFLFLTAPIAAHMLGRASYFDGIPLWEKTIINELEGKYDLTEHKLLSPDDNVKADNKKDV